MDFIKKLDDYLKEATDDPYELMKKELAQVELAIKAAPVAIHGMKNQLKVALKHLNAAITYANKVK